MTDSDWVRRAHQVLPGGSLGSFALPSGEETVITRCSGASLNDTDGR